MGRQVKTWKFQKGALPLCLGYPIVTTYNTVQIWLNAAWMLEGFEILSCKHTGLVRQVNSRFSPPWANNNC